jgi:hypothetical protein
MEMELLPRPVQVEQAKGKYVIDGRNYIRVTSILKMIDKPGLLNWMGTVGLAEANKIMETRAQFGTDVHAHIASILRGNPVPVDQISDYEMRGCVQSFLRWKNKMTLGDYHTEALIYSKQYGYAGTTDMYGVLNGLYGIIDWKTSKDVYIEAFLQISAYAQGVYEMTGRYPMMGGVVSLQEEKYVYKHIDGPTLQGLFPVFLAARKIYDWKGGSWLNNIKIEQGKEEGEDVERETSD